MSRFKPRKLQFEVNEPALGDDGLEIAAIDHVLTSVPGHTQVSKSIIHCWEIKISLLTERIKRLTLKNFSWFNQTLYIIALFYEKIHMKEPNV